MPPPTGTSASASPSYSAATIERDIIGTHVTVVFINGVKYYGMVYAYSISEETIALLSFSGISDRPRVRLFRLQYVKSIDPQPIPNSPVSTPSSGNAKGGNVPTTPSSSTPLHSPLESSPTTSGREKLPDGISAGARLPLMSGTEKLNRYIKKNVTSATEARRLTLNEFKDEPVHVNAMNIFLNLAKVLGPRNVSWDNNMITVFANILITPFSSDNNKISSHSSNDWQRTPNVLFKEGAPQDEDTRSRLLKIIQNCTTDINNSK